MCVQVAHEEQAGAELARVAAAQGESVDKLQERLAARRAERAKDSKRAEPADDAGKPTLLSLEACRQLKPVKSYFGGDGPQDDKLTVYGMFEGNELYTPTRGPLVTGAPFQVCLVTGPDVEEVGVLADGEFGRER